MLFLVAAEPKDLPRNAVTEVRCWSVSAETQAGAEIVLRQLRNDLRIVGVGQLNHPVTKPEPCEST